MTCHFVVLSKFARIEIERLHRLRRIEFYHVFVKITKHYEL